MNVFNSFNKVVLVGKRFVNVYKTDATYLNTIK